MPLEKVSDLVVLCGLVVGVLPELGEREERVGGEMLRNRAQ